MDTTFRKDYPAGVYTLPTRINRLLVPHVRPSLGRGRVWLSTTFTLSNPIHESSQTGPPRQQGVGHLLTAPVSVSGTRSVYVHHWPQVTTYIFSKTFSDSHTNGKLKLCDPWKELNKLVDRAVSVRPRVWLHAQSWFPRRDLKVLGSASTEQTTTSQAASRPSL